MRFLSLALRMFTLLFTAGVSLFLVAVGSIGFITGEEIRFPLIPVLEDNALLIALIVLGVLGLDGVVLSVMQARFGHYQMLIWNLAVVSLLICAATRSSYRFSGPEHLESGLYLFGISLLALWGSWIHLKAGRKPKREATPEAR